MSRRRGRRRRGRGRGRAGRGARKPGIEIAADLVPLSVADLTRVLKQHEESLETRRKDRNYYQLERDRVNEFWDITKRKLSDCNARIRLTDDSIQQAEENHQVQLKVYKQKVRHLLYAQKIAIDTLKIANENSLTGQSQQFLSEKNMLKAEKRRLKTEVEQADATHEETVKNLKSYHERQLTKERVKSREELERIVANYEKKVEQLKEDMALRRHKDIDEIETRKNLHIRRLIENHRESFDKIKTYYRTITSNNLRLIKTLRANYDTLKKNEEENENLIFEIAMENRKLTEPLEWMKNEARELERSLQNYKKAKMTLRQTKARLRVSSVELKQVQGEHSKLEEQFQGIEREKNELQEVFKKTIHQIQQKTHIKSQISEARVEHLQRDLERKKTILRHVIEASSLPPDVIREMEIRG